MGDYIVRATAANEQVRAFAITSKNLVEEARKAHNTSAEVTAALGRSLSAALMMGSMMKGEKDLLTLRLQGDGPMRGVTVTADASGHVKGFALQPRVDLPLKNGKLDVGGALGNGIIQVIKDLGLKEPYVGSVDLQTGEIAEDLTYYFAVSEQTPSSVGLGVLVNPDESVMEAGGFIIQLMPETTDETIDQLEANISNLPSVTSMLADGLTPEEILEKVLEGMDLEITARMDAKFKCDCSRERVERSLISLSDEDLEEIISDDKPVEVRCQFCNKAYNFTIPEMKELKEMRIQAREERHKARQERIQELQEKQKNKNK